MELTQLHFSRSKITNVIHVANTAEEAIKFLQEIDGRTKPDLVLLDLNLPGISGREVLEFVKSDVNLRTIPVVVLTSSQEEEDVLKSYELHANAYVTKPVTLDGLAKLVTALEDFWFTVVRLTGAED